jgi:hypothetical protein
MRGPDAAAKQVALSGPARPCVVRPLSLADDFDEDSFAAAAVELVVENVLP